MVRDRRKLKGGKTCFSKSKGGNNFLMKEAGSKINYPEKNPILLGITQTSGLRL